MTGLNNPNLMFGVRVRVVPDFIDMPLTWSERLRSWRPWIAFRRVENQMVPQNTVLVINDPVRPYDPVLVVRESGFAALRRRLQHHQAYDLMHPGEESFRPAKPH